MTILGTKFTDRVDVAAIQSQSIVTSPVRYVTHEAELRNTNPVMRIIFLHVFMLARVWYIAQILSRTSGEHSPVQHLHDMVNMTWRYLQCLQTLPANWETCWRMERIPCMREVSGTVHKTPTCAERTIWHLYMYERCVGQCS